MKPASVGERAFQISILPKTEGLQKSCAHLPTKKSRPGPAQQRAGQPGLCRPWFFSLPPASQAFRVASSLVSLLLHYPPWMLTPLRGHFTVVSTTGGFLPAFTHSPLLSAGPEGKFFTHSAMYFFPTSGGFCAKLGSKCSYLYSQGWS